MKIGEARKEMEAMYEPLFNAEMALEEAKKGTDEGKRSSTQAAYDALMMEYKEKEAVYVKAKGNSGANRGGPKQDGFMRRIRRERQNPVRRRGGYGKSEYMVWKQENKNKPPFNLLKGKAKTAALQAAWAKLKGEEEDDEDDAMEEEEEGGGG